MSSGRMTLSPEGAWRYGVDAALRSRNGAYRSITSIRAGSAQNNREARAPETPGAPLHTSLTPPAAQGHVEPALKRITASFKRDASGAIDISSINIASIVSSGSKPPTQADSGGQSTAYGATVAVINIDMAASASGAADPALLRHNIEIAYGSLTDILLAASALSGAHRSQDLQGPPIEAPQKSGNSGTAQDSVDTVRGSAELASGLLRALFLPIANQLGDGAREFHL